MVFFVLFLITLLFNFLIIFFRVSYLFWCIFFDFCIVTKTFFRLFAILKKFLSIFSRYFLLSFEKFINVIITCLCVIYRGWLYLKLFGIKLFFRFWHFQVALIISGRLRHFVVSRFKNLVLYLHLQFCGCFELDMWSIFLL